MLYFPSFILFIFLSIIASGITATILYSDIFKEIREKWWCYFNRKTGFINKIKYLSVCSLCLGFHVSNYIQWIIIPFTSIITYILISFGVSFIIWGLCTFVQMCDWKKALNELRYKNEEQINFNKE